MYAADFPLMFEAGLHGRNTMHLSDLGLTIDGKPLHNRNPELAEYTDPKRVVRVASDTGDPEQDRRLVQYAKATIQSGDGPGRTIANPMVPGQHIAGLVNEMEADPDWAPYVKVAHQNQPKVATSMECPKCGTNVSPGRSHCTNCGHEFEDEADARPGGYDNPQDEYGDWMDDKESSWKEAVNPAAAAREQKEANPDKFCSNPKCLYRTSEEYCPKHAPQAKQAAIEFPPCPSCGQVHTDWENYPWARGHLWSPSTQHMTTPEELAKGYNDMMAGAQGDLATLPETAHPLGDHMGGWHEAGPMQQFEMNRGDFAGAQGTTQGTTVCPHCGTLNQAGSTQCAKCGTKLGLPAQQNSGGPSNAYSNPYTGIPAVASVVKGEMSKWHLADLAAQPPGMQTQPDTVDGPFNDHRDVSEMSPEQSQGHQRLVNIVVDEMNKTISGGGTVDATLVQNLVQWLVDKFGQDADSAQAIVDAASKQAQTSDGRLDNTPVVPDPAEQAIQPAQGDVVSDGQPQNNGAFAHVRTPSGKVGHVTDTWEDMYGEKWASVITADNYRESVPVEDLVEEATPGTENAVEELKEFIDSMEPVEASVASIKARMANVRILKQEIRRHMANPRLSLEQRYALDQMDADASIEMLELTDAVPTTAEAEKSYLESLRPYEPSFSEDQQATLHGVEELQIEEPPAPEWSNEALDAFLPEEAEIMVSELAPEIRSNPGELEAVAAAFVDKMTAGHAPEDRVRHRTRFVAAALTVAADYQTTDEPEHIDTTDHDGPAEGIFV